jgi:hypothetical protein
VDAIERIKRISPPVRPGGWFADDFRRAKAEGYRRWRETRDVLEIEYDLFGDPVAKLEPGFELTADELKAIAAIEVPLGGGNCPRYALASFVRWEQCPLTRRLPNPFEPWIQIWENGGAITVEHAQFVDVTFAERAPDGKVRHDRV